jgi:hypothetical protein
VRAFCGIKSNVMEKVDFLSNGTFFKEGVYKIEKKRANYLEDKGYGHVVKPVKGKTTSKK